MSFEAWHAEFCLSPPDPEQDGICLAGYDAARREALAEKLPCGHPRACLVDIPLAGTVKEDEVHGCAWCADLERAKEAVREACAKLMESAYLWGHGPDTAPKALARQIRALDLSKVGGYH